MLERFHAGEGPSTPRTAACRKDKRRAEEAADCEDEPMNKRRGKDKLKSAEASKGANGKENRRTAAVPAGGKGAGQKGGGAAAQLKPARAQKK